MLSRRKPHQEAEDDERTLVVLQEVGVGDGVGEGADVDGAWEEEEEEEAGGEDAEAHAQAHVHPPERDGGVQSLAGHRMLLSHHHMFHTKASARCQARCIRIVAHRTSIFG